MSEPSQAVSVLPLGYEGRIKSTWPAMLSVVGAISVVLGMMGIVTAAGAIAGGLWWGSLPMSSTLMGPQGGYPIPPITAMPAAPQGSIRQMSAIEDFDRVQPNLSAPQRDLLFTLIMKAGDALFGSPEPDPARNWFELVPIKKWGHSQDGNGKLEASFFILRTGQIDLIDDRAIFTPTSGPTVSVDRTAGNILSAPVKLVAIKTTVIHPEMGLLYALLSLGNLALAVMLARGGIQLLRREPQSRRLHLKYAWSRIVLSIGIGFLYGWMLNIYVSGVMDEPSVLSFAELRLHLDLLQRLGMGTGPASLCLAAIVATLIACIYPLVLIIVMNTQTAGAALQPAQPAGAETNG